MRAECSTSLGGDILGLDDRPDDAATEVERLWRAASGEEELQHRPGQVEARQRPDSVKKCEKEGGAKRERRLQTAAEVEDERIGFWMCDSRCCGSTVVNWRGAMTSTTRANELRDVAIDAQNDFRRCCGRRGCCACCCCLGKDCFMFAKLSSAPLLDDLFACSASVGSVKCSSL